MLYIFAKLKIQFNGYKTCHHDHHHECQDDQECPPSTGRFLAKGHLSVAEGNLLVAKGHNTLHQNFLTLPCCVLHVFFVILRNVAILGGSKVSWHFGFKVALFIKHSSLSYIYIYIYKNICYFKVK